AVTYLLPPLNSLRAFEAAARHLSFKFAARQLHATPGAVGQQVKPLRLAYFRSATARIDKKRSNLFWPRTDGPSKLVGFSPKGAKLWRPRSRADIGPSDRDRLACSRKRKDRTSMRRPPANQKIYCMCLARKLDP